MSSSCCDCGRPSKPGPPLRWLTLFKQTGWWCDECAGDPDWEKFKEKNRRVCVEYVTREKQK